MRSILQIPHPAVMAFVVVVAVGSTSGQTDVTGVVLDATGTAVPHALVEALPRSRGGARSTLGDRLNPWTPTDENGKFTMKLSPGRYKIRAKAESLGYPDPVYWLNADPTAAFPELTVSEGDKEIRDVRVTFGRKGGTVAGELVSRGSRTAIVRGKITFRDAQNPAAYVEVFSDATGRFEFTAPSRPIIVSASATGYRAGGFAGGAELTLSPGERREIVVELTPH